MTVDSDKIRKERERRRQIADRLQPGQFYVFQQSFRVYDLANHEVDYLLFKIRRFDFTGVSEKPTNEFPYGPRELASLFLLFADRLEENKTFSILDLDIFCQAHDERRM